MNNKDISNFELSKLVHEMQFSIGVLYATVDKIKELSIKHEYSPILDFMKAREELTDKAIKDLSKASFTISDLKL
jgi:hypothetical protein